VAAIVAALDLTHGAISGTTVPSTAFDAGDGVEGEEIEGARVLLVGTVLVVVPAFKLILVLLLTLLRWLDVLRGGSGWSETARLMMIYSIE